MNGAFMVARNEQNQLANLARELNRAAPGIVTVDGPYLDEVRGIEEAGKLRELVVADMLDRAQYYATPNKPFNPEAPFVYYPPMNKEPEAWLALAKAREVKFELGVGDGRGWVIMTVPRSANWEEEVIRAEGVFPEADYWPLTKDEGMIPKELAPQKIEVLSYVHNRNSDGSRGVEPMFIAQPDALAGRRVLLFDDALAQGPSTVMLAQALVDKFGVTNVDVAVTLSKGRIQGGYETVMGSGKVGKLLVMGDVVAVDEGLRGMTESVPVRGRIEFEEG